MTLVIIAGGAVAGAQNFMRRSRAPMREPTGESFDGGFTFCRGMYTAVRRNRSGVGWTTDYPDADINFSIRLSSSRKRASAGAADLTARAVARAKPIP